MPIEQLREYVHNWDRQRVAYAMQLKDILVALGGNALLQRGEPPLPEIQASFPDALLTPSRTLPLADLHSS